MVARVRLFDIRMCEVEESVGILSSFFIFAMMNLNVS